METKKVALKFGIHLSYMYSFLNLLFDSFIKDLLIITIILISILIFFLFLFKLLDNNYIILFFHNICINIFIVLYYLSFTHKIVVYSYFLYISVILNICLNIVLFIERLLMTIQDENEITNIEIIEPEIIPDIQVINIVNMNTRECSICLENIDINKECSETILCKHIFHTECILIWNTYGNSCPLCRK